jgi:hypothetical protein
MEFLHPHRQVCFLSDGHWYVWTTEGRNLRTDPYRRCRWWRLGDWVARWRQARYARNLMGKISDERPFRHLCPEADLRDAMSDEDFWAHVFKLDEEYDGPTYDEPALGPLTEPCEECGAVGACAWDAEGRPLIHPVTEEEEIPWGPNV